MFISVSFSLQQRYSSRQFNLLFPKKQSKCQEMKTSGKSISLDSMHYSSEVGLRVYTSFVQTSKEEGDIYACLPWVTEGSQGPLQTQMQSFPLAWGISYGPISTLLIFQDLSPLSSLQKAMLFLLRYFFLYLRLPQKIRVK